MDVVSADIAPHLVLKVPDRGSFMTDTVTNMLFKQIQKSITVGDQLHTDACSVPLYRFGRRHVYAQIYCPTPSYFTHSQRMKRQKQFFHPSVKKLFNFFEMSKTK